jgi:Xaa-Pro dipeptidase
MFKPEILPELRNRWKTIQKEMTRKGADGCLIAGNVNLFYVTDRVYSGYFYLPVKGDPLFFVRRPVGLNGENVFYIRKPEQITEILNKEGIVLPRTILLELDELPYNDVIRQQSIFLPEQTLNATATLRKVRSIKSDYETGLLRRSGEQHAACYAEVPNLYKQGMTDIDFSIEIERLFRQKGAIGHFRVFGQSMEIFMGSVISGANADNPSPYDFAMGGGGLHNSLPVSANGAVMAPGTTVMVDMGGTFTGYISDMTRVFSIGKVSPLAYKACDLYNLALEKVKKQELLPYFMGYSQQAGFIGHGIGIQINESPVLAPRSKDELKEGHIFALEPKFVIPGVGAVGIENSFAVNKNGIEKLTVLNEEIIEL